MRAQDFIAEARRNPQLNPRIKQGHVGAAEYLAKIPKEQAKNLGVHMSIINKVGINPSAYSHDTPIGIYFYPVDYYISTILGNDRDSDTEYPIYRNVLSDYEEEEKLKRIEQGKSVSFLPWAHEFEYIHVITLPAPITYLQKVTKEQGSKQLLLVGKTLNSMLGVLDAHNNYYGTSAKNRQHLNPNLNIESDSDDIEFRIPTDHHPIDSFSDMILKHYNKSKFEYGKALWDTTHELTKILYPILNSRYGTIWNWLLRTMGYNTIIDMGGDIIFDGEPTQGVVLIPNQIKLIKTFINKDKD